MNATEKAMSAAGGKGGNLDLSVDLNGLKLQNPILTASGTFGYGEEMAPFVDLGRLGAIIGKTITTQPRSGNAPPRTCEVASGMLNAIGLQNVGAERFLAEKLPALRTMRRRGGPPLIVNIAGDSVEDFAALAELMSDASGTSGDIAALELNISCPNVAHGLDFATDPQLTEELVRRVRGVTNLPIIVKLSPNVSDITVIARAAEAGGADALSLVNTFVGMAIDIRTRRPRLSNITGGLSGPAIKPLALRAVHRCAGAVGIPLIGIGGIMGWEDAVEFLLAGASAVQIGTASFVRPDSATLILDGLCRYMQQNGFASTTELVGAMQSM
jgi:dihydroorotate dehydrogenase (NAD+) catalytic subunit